MAYLEGVRYGMRIAVVGYYTNIGNAVSILSFVSKINGSVFSGFPKGQHC